MLISEIYNPNPKTLSHKATVYEALRSFEKEKTNAITVVDENKKVVGVLALQDITAHTIPNQFRKNARMAAAMYKPGFFTEMCQPLKDQLVTEVMRKEFMTVGLDDNIMAVTADFLQNDLYVVPVLENGKFIGIITRTEIKKALLYGMRDMKSE